MQCGQGQGLSSALPFHGIPNRRRPQKLRARVPMDTLLISTTLVVYFEKDVAGRAWHLTGSESDE
jgi:hypothetical protein